MYVNVVVIFVATSVLRRGGVLGFFPLRGIGFPSVISLTDERVSFLHLDSVRPFCLYPAA